MDISAGIASAKTAMDIAKTLKEINKSYSEATYKANIIDLIEKLSDTKLALIEEKEQILDKDKEIIYLKMP